MSGVGKAFGSATDFLVGGKPKDTYSKTQAKSQGETDRTNDIETQLKALYGQQGQSAGDQNLEKMFRDHLVSYMTSSQKGAAPSPEELAQATDFIDQTFTKPSEQRLQQYGDQFQTSAQANAAALGRNPNLDIATQQAIAGEMARQGMNLQADRGSRIAQQAQDFRNQGLSQQAGGLNAALQGSSFLNNLNQQAFANRMGLLGARSDINNSLQRDRLSNITQGGGGTSSGLLTNIAAIGGGVSNAMNAWNGSSQANSAISPATNLMGSMGGASGAAGGAAAFMSDIKAKEKIKSASNDIHEFLSNLSAYSYDYKNPEKHGDGRRYSVMAQDLEKSEIGKSLIIDTPEGKMIDYAKALPVILAAQAEIFKKLEEL